MATIGMFFAKINKQQGVKYLIKEADHAELPCLNDCALIQEGNSSCHMNYVSSTMKMISHRIFDTLHAAEETIKTNSYVDLFH